MHATPYLLPKDPRWQQQVRLRLVVGYLLATLLVAAVLAVLRFPFAQVIPPGPEILIRLLPRIIEPLADPPAEVVEQTIGDEMPATTETLVAGPGTAAVEDAGATETAKSLQGPPDWYGQIDAAAREAVDEMEQIVSVNPMMDAKRRAAAEQFYASLAPEKKEIWDNVETDQLGRKILWAGDCYRIIDDPSPATYEIWREFQQYFVYCKFGGSDPRMLPWAEAIRDRYLYLKYPDGEIPEAELRQYVER